jgi:hypothetical protein
MMKAFEGVRVIAMPFHGSVLAAAARRGGP